MLTFTCEGGVAESFDGQEVDEDAVRDPDAAFEELVAASEVRSSDGGAQRMPEARGKAAGS
jgi:hypothetical protein